MKLSILFFALVLSQGAHAKNYKTADQNFKLEKVLDKSGVIWGFDFLNSKEILFTKKKGRVFHYNLETKKLREIKDGPKSVLKGQGGLLDLQIHKGFVYITYTCKVGNLYSTCLGRGLVSSKAITNFKNIFTAKARGSGGRHFGSRVSFDHKGHLFMTVGDRGERDKSQSLKYHNGKILRMKLDGSESMIWTLGHRNPQGIFYDTKTKLLWSSEFGPRGGDELNLIIEGKNYGWPLVTHGSEYYGPSIGVKSKRGYESPVIHYTPSISPSAMTVYRGKSLKGYDGDIFLAALGSQFLQRVVIKNKKVIKQERLLEDLSERIRMVRGGPEGGLYFSTDSGKIFRLVELK